MTSMGVACGYVLERIGCKAALAVEQSVSVFGFGLVELVCQSLISIQSFLVLAKQYRSNVYTVQLLVQLCASSSLEIRKQAKRFGRVGQPFDVRVRDGIGSNRTFPGEEGGDGGSPGSRRQMLESGTCEGV